MVSIKPLEEVTIEASKFTTAATTWVGITLVEGLEAGVLQEEVTSKVEPSNKIEDLSRNTSINGFVSMVRVTTAHLVPARAPVQILVIGIITQVKTSTTIAKA